MDQPDTNMERYDRQIRLWGQHGQSKCLSAKVCLINANGLGVEVLKGLCLAGIGSFVILDSHKLSNDDLGSIFISQTASSIGKMRGEMAKGLVVDVNENVACEVFPLETHLPHVTQKQTNCDRSNQEAPTQDLDFWKQFNCVIASGSLCLSQITRLSQICWSLNIALIMCKSIGFYGSMRSQIREHLVVETHPDWRPRNWDPNKIDSVVVRTSPLHEDYDVATCNIGDEDDEDDFVTISICLRALDLFFTTYNRLPGVRDDQVETDVGKLKDCARQNVGRSLSRLKTLDQCLYELCRYGGAELHTTSAFVGGCVAQEVIKLVTNQYIPVDDTMVYNAISATTRSFKSKDKCVRQVVACVA